ncbi:MAG TPA: DEAD/DEAH box helicase, partial [Bacteroidetes bacterium]|nr:DEAD/DEAH box helicase [Bacteroidota bacterium]
MHKNLFKFFEFDKDKRNLVLGIKEPGKPVNTNDKDLEEDLTILQKSVVNSILSSQDYYLLWGPPGTGKTSKIIRSVVNALYQKGQQIMLLAYTNRAVDELCEAVESISEEMKNLYYRIGSKYSSGKDYAENLFDNKIKSISTRKKFQEFIDKIPIVVGTVSSIQGKEGLFALKKFDTLIVDEASQLLEPMLLSIIPYFNKFVLVGDHRQLPAVVKQKNTDSTVKSEELKEIGLTNLSNSLFERLLQNAERKNWSWAIGMLQEQGRMHSDIMKLPNDLFYEGKLKTINSIHRLENPLKLDHSKSEVQEVLASNRLIFVPSQINRNQVLSKINIDEANKIKTIIENIIEIYNRNNLEINEKTIGIITTFRAQITKIKHELENYGIDISKISIDTVERYQGSARDIIIFSMSVNSVSRLKQIISKDDDGIDRKLNVVITRAKEQFILLGNENIIEKNDLYRSIKNNSSVLNLDI